MARGALRFEGLLDGGDDLLRHGQAEVGGDEGVFELLQRFASQLGRARDDAFDLVRQLAVGLGQPGFEFGEEAYGEFSIFDFRLMN